MARSGEMSTLDDQPTSAAPIRWTALAVGALLCVFIEVAAAYVYLVLYTNRIASDYLAPAALFLFFVLVGGLNSLLGTVHSRWAFSTQELIVIYIMMTVASVLPSEGFVGNLLPMMTGVFYYATPENSWSDAVHPYVPDALVVSDPEAVKQFYEGSPIPGQIPWDVWLPPLALWLSLILAVYWVMICMMSIMRKQWVEHERLVFPLTQLPLEMTREDGDSKVRPFFKSRMMWFAFAIPFVILNFNGLHHHFPSVPRIRMWTQTYLFRRTTIFRFFASFLVTGLAYFLNLEIAFSLWFFHLLARIESGFLSLVGFSLKGRYNEVLVAGSSPAVSVQGIGAMAVLVIYGGWGARRHLKEVFSKAFGHPSAQDDSNELLAGRTAVFGLIGGLAFICLWLGWSGMSPLVIPLFLGVAFVIFLALARVIAEGGVGFARTQMPPQPFVVNSVGTSVMNSSTLTSLTYTYSWAANSRVTIMAMVINGLRLGGAVKLRLRRLLVPVVIALLVGLASSIWITLKLAYTHGGINLEGWFFTWQARAVFNFLSDKIINPVGLDITLGRCVFTAIGAAVMWVLMFLRHHFVWWPLHYLGYPISDSWIMSWVWFGIFLGWLLKATILRYGGPRLYVRMRPFFLGLILGHLCVIGLWGIVDVITGTPGNYIRVGAP